MMMGTAGELPKAPEKPTQFIEDMTDAERAEAVGVIYITGLENKTIRIMKYLYNLTFHYYD